MRIYRPYNTSFYLGNTISDPVEPLSLPKILNSIGNHHDINDPFATPKSVLNEQGRLKMDSTGESDEIGIRNPFHNAKNVIDKYEILKNNYLVTLETVNLIKRHSHVLSEIITLYIIGKAIDGLSSGGVFSQHPFGIAGKDMSDIIVEPNPSISDSNIVQNINSTMNTKEPINLAQEIIRMGQEKLLADQQNREHDGLTSKSVIESAVAIQNGIRNLSQGAIIYKTLFCMEFKSTLPYF